MKRWFSSIFTKRHTHDKEQQALIQEKEDMIEGIEGLSETTVKEIMIPRIDVIFIPEDVKGEDLLKIIFEYRHSRYPVYTETIDNVTGILHAKDLLHNIGQPLDALTITTMVRKPYFVPESMRLDALLREMKKRKTHIAVVVDEYGGVSGIVCMEDILEEIIGDIQDEFDNERDDIIPLGGNVFLCDARSSLDDISEVLSRELPADDFDTLGGFVFDLFGKIPVRFEKVRWMDVDFIIQDMDGHKIKSIKIVKRQGRDSDDES